MGRLDGKAAIVAGAGSIAEGWSNGGQTASTTGKVWED